MQVDAKQGPGRRRLRFTTLDEIVHDAERLVAAKNARTLGNWSLDRLLSHLAIAVDGSIDGISGQAPGMIRLLGPLLKHWVLKRGLSPGFRLPKKLEAAAFPAGSSPDEAFRKLRSAVARTAAERMTARHPVFGKLSHAEWEQFHLRHAELHLSFAIV